MNSFRQKIIADLTFPLIAYRDGLPSIKTQLKNLLKSQYWPKEQLKEYQLQRLKSLCIHAYQHTFYYRKVFDEAGFDPFRFRSLDEFEKLPFLSKEIIRNKLPALISTIHKTKDLHYAETGGTTGVKMKFCRDNSSLSPKEAALLRFDYWSGWRIGEPRGLVWPAQQDYVGYWSWKSKLKNSFYRRELVFPAAVVDDQKIEEYVKLLLKRKPTFIKAFPSPLYQIAQYIKNNNITIISMKGIVTTGEPLTRYQRKIISEAFNCRVYDSYRTREAGPIAQECECQQGLHINAEELYVETVASKNFKIFHENIQEIVVTDLLNFGMPLIRYRIGDYGKLSERMCGCGRTLPLLEKISGRTGDVFYTPEHKKVMAASLVLYLIDEAPGTIGQMQIIQDQLDHLIIKVTPKPPLTDNIKTYHFTTIKRLFGNKMRVSYETVDSIPLEEGGKYRFTKCLLPDSIKLKE